jgi:hypothetical protein
MFPAGEVSSYKTNLWSTNHGKKELLKWFVKHKFLLYLFIFTLEIVGYFFFLQNQWHLSYCKITIKF